MLLLSSPRLKKVLIGIIILSLCLSTFYFTIDSAVAENRIDVISSGARSEFPEGIHFWITVTGKYEISKITIRFQILGERSQRYDNLIIDNGPTTHGELLVRVDTADRYIPPGATIRYHFEIQDSLGSDYRTDPKEFVLLDPRFTWESISSTHASILYYGTSKELAQLVLSDAQTTLGVMSDLIGTTIAQPLVLTMYNNSNDMKSALPSRSKLQEQTLVIEGTSFGSTGVVLVLGNSPRVRGVTSHEVVHFLVQEAMGGKSRIVPAWLNEGLAEYGSTQPNPFFDETLAISIRQGKVLPITSMTSPPGQPEDILLFYGQAKSIVTYMIETYGPAQLQKLIMEISGGASIDQALSIVYGFDRIGLEEDWRRSVGAPPRPNNSSPASVPIPTPWPTIVPYGSEPSAPAVDNNTDQTHPNSKPAQASGSCNRTRRDIGLPGIILYGGMLAIWVKRPKSLQLL